MHDYVFMIVSNDDERTENLSSAKCYKTIVKGILAIKLESLDHIFSEWKKSDKKIFFIKEDDHFFVRSFEYYLIFGSSFCHCVLFGEEIEEKTIIVKRQPDHCSIFRDELFIVSLLQYLMFDISFMTKILIIYHEFGHITCQNVNSRDLVNFLINYNLHDLFSFCGYIEIPSRIYTNCSRDVHLMMRKVLSENKNLIQ